MKPKKLDDLEQTGQQQAFILVQGPKIAAKVGMQEFLHLHF